VITFHPGTNYHVTQRGDIKWMELLRPEAIKADPFVQQFVDLHWDVHPLKTGLTALLQECFALMSFTPEVAYLRFVVRCYKDEDDTWIVKLTYRPGLTTETILGPEEKRFLPIQKG